MKQSTGTSLSGFQRYALVGALLLLPLSADAIREDCTDGLSSELPVRVKIEVPAFLYFQVGSEAQRAKVTFDVSDAMPAQGPYPGTIPPASGNNLQPSSIQGSDVSDGVNVQVRANCGQVKISYSVSDAQGLGNASGDHVAFDTLNTLSTDGSLPAPVLSNAATHEVNVATISWGSVTDRSATWKYSYTNADMPVAGVYQGSVIYQASCL